MGCNDEISFNQGNGDNLIVVHAQAEVGQRLRLEVSQSELVTEDTLENPINDVGIELFINGLFKEFVYSNTKGNAVFNYVVKAKDSLSIAINKPPFDAISSVAIVPSTMGILQFDTTNKRPQVQGLRISFFDQPLEVNFYQVSLQGQRWFYTLDKLTGQRTDSALGYEYVQMTSINRLFFSDNNIVNNRQNFELLNDKVFNGKNFVLDVDINTFQLEERHDRGEIQRLDIELKNISADYYNFLTTLSINRPVYGGPFSISSQVPSNIRGGYGIFAAYSTDKATILLK
jgi:hypothetical protein